MKSSALLLALCLALSLTACGKDEPVTTEKSAAPAAVEQTTQMAQPATEKVAQEALVSGEEIYNKTCSSCHMAGVLDAPKVGDQATWSALSAKGQEKLVANAINGIGKMPAKGGAKSLTDAEVAAAVEFMVEQSR